MNKHTTVMALWKSVLRKVLDEGDNITDTFDNRIFKEVKNIIMDIDDFSDITSPIETVGSSQKWVYPRVDEIANITLTRKESPTYLYTYGQRIFNYGNKMNQINEFIIPLLKDNPTTRRAIISLWDPLSDGNQYNKEVPSITSVYFRIRDNLLQATLVVRSCDMLFGFPSNVYQGFLLQEFVANKLDLKLGTLTFVIMSAHLFQDQVEDVEEILRKS